MSKVAKATIGLMMVTMLAKILGFIRETVLVSTYGPGMITDAYITSMNIPTVIFATIGSALATTFIPLFFEVEKERGKDEALKFSNNIFNIVIILSITLAVFGFIFAEPLTKIFAIKFEGETLLLATKFTKIIIWSIVFIGLSNIMTCWLQIKGSFNIPGMISIPQNIIIIISIILSIYSNVNMMAIGTLIGAMSLFLFQYPFALKKGFKYKSYISLKDEYIKKMAILIIPVLIGVGVNQVNVVFDRSLASTLGKGMITILNSANRLNGFVQGIFISTIIAVIYPILSKLSTSGNNDEFSDSIKKSINIVSILIIPISVGAIILAEPVVRLVFQRGQFDTTSTSLTASALIAYSIGMIAYSLRDVLNKVFYSLQDTKTPMINGILNVVLNIVFSIALIKYMGHVGPALATSISAIICILIMFISLKRSINYFGQDNILRTMLICILSAITMGIVTKLLYMNLSTYLGIGIIPDIISLLTSVVLGATVYTILLVIFKVEEVHILIDRIKQRLNTRI